MGKADLHLHTTASDGTLTPEEIVRKAEASNLSVISLTDHDTTAGLLRAQKEAKSHGIEVLNGAELTCRFNGRDCHLLAYLFDREDAGLNKLLEYHQKQRVDRASDIIHQLSKKGINIDLDEIIAEANGSSLGRPHIAAVMEHKSIVASQKEAFIRYLSDQKLEITPPKYRTVEEAIDVVHLAGGVGILAHPGRLYKQEELDLLVQKGIDGIEVVHPSHTDALQSKYRKFADDHQLLKTGGSDFHGKTAEESSKLGKITIDQQRVTELKEGCRKYQKVLA